MKYREHEINFQHQIRRPVGGEILNSDFVYGVDTESFHSTQLNTLHTAMVQTSDSLDDFCDEPKTGESPFHFMIDRAFQKHSIEMKNNTRKSKTELKRNPGKRGRGRPQLPMILLTFYNLEYDIQRLFLANSPFFDMARINTEGLKVVVDGYEIENVHMVLHGSAPHFSWIIRKDNRIYESTALIFGDISNKV